MQPTNPVSFGQGSPLLGGTAQMAASMGGTPEIGQESPSSVGFVPSLQVPQSPPMPNHHLMAALARRQGNTPNGQPTMPTGQTVPSQSPTNSAGGSIKMPVSEVELILKALEGHLEHRQNMEKMKLESEVGGQLA